jgi:L-asparaginase II
MSNYQGAILAELTRNGIVESVHSGHLLILNKDGSVDLSKGDIESSDISKVGRKGNSGNCNGPCRT